MTDLAPAVARYSRAHRWAAPGDLAQSDPEWLRAHGLALILSTGLHGSVMLAHSIGGDHRDALAVEADRLTLAGDWRGEMLHRWLAGKADDADLARRLLDGVEACSMCYEAGRIWAPPPPMAIDCPMCEGRGARLTSDPGVPPFKVRVREAIERGDEFMVLVPRDVPDGFRAIAWDEPSSSRLGGAVRCRASIRGFRWRTPDGVIRHGRAVMLRDQHGISLVERR